MVGGLRDIVEQRRAGQERFLVDEAAAGYIHEDGAVPQVRPRTDKQVHRHDGTWPRAES